MTYDNTAPTVIINQAAAQADPTNTSPINFTVVFSEPVTGFTGADVALSGTAGATTAVVRQALGVRVHRVVMLRMGTSSTSMRRFCLRLASSTLGTRG